MGVDPMVSSAWSLKSVLNVKAVVAAFSQEKALVGAFSVIVQPVVEPMDRFAALITTHNIASRHARKWSCWGSSSYAALF